MILGRTLGDAEGTSRISTDNSAFRLESSWDNPGSFIGMDASIPC
jgi:hypothetical protein